ncbi:helix-turn-helix transcriptional regulator [Ascidiaceihabitans sp.]|uniref:PadR family transcriptional regulator n=1 Tax=Ascidiaceihabitans sp. TaxID=1872644 RepID=UPI0032988623
MQHVKLSDRELKVMLAILRCAMDAYGPRIGEKLEEHTGERLSLGALHSALERLEDRGLVDSHMGAATAVRGGRRKRMYEVKAEGQIAVQHAVAVIGRMAEGVVSPLDEVGEGGVA